MLENKTGFQPTLTFFLKAKYQTFLSKKKENPIYRRDNLSKISNLNYFVGCLENKVVAVLEINDKTEDNNCGEIVCFYCLPQYQRLGIGSKLFNFAKNQFTLAGLKKFKVEVLKENKIGCNFYIKQKGKLVSSKNKLFNGKLLTFLTFEFDI